MPASEITEHFHEAHCLPKLQGETKEEVITELIEAFVNSGVLGEAEAPELFGEILAREEEATTGVGMGVALPHVRRSDVVEATHIAVGLHAAGVEWQAVDGGPVHIVFLIASPDPEEYLAVAGRIMKAARDNTEMKALLRQTTAKKIHKFLEESWRA
jgi:PTS system fructose-specific IIC component